MTNVAVRSVLVVGLAWMLVAAPPTHAEPAKDPALPSAPERPWAAGVSEAEQAIARELYSDGNREFIESRFAQALAQYKEAIRHWDHPAIRYNMAICLINLEQPLEARENLERGLAYGAAPLDTDKYAQGLTYRKLLDAQLARVKITCPEQGAEVMLDGKRLFTAPGAADAFVLPGEHQIVVTRSGFLTVSKTLVAVTGKRTSYDFLALERRTTTRTVRRWTPWKPWAVLVGGVALSGLGALSYVVAERNYATYDRGIAANCPGTKGCDAAMYAALSHLRDLQDRAGREQVIAFSLFAVGGAAAAVGLVGLVVNQPRVQLEPSRSLVVTPISGGAVAAMRWAF